MTYCDNCKRGIPVELYKHTDGVRKGMFCKPLCAMKKWQVKTGEAE